MTMRTCVSPDGKFFYCVHSPEYRVKNLRHGEKIESLGALAGSTHRNEANFPTTDIRVHQADTIYEIPHFFPFKGTTFINSRWADARAKNPLAIHLQAPQPVSLSTAFAPLTATCTVKTDELFGMLPEPMLLSLATTSTDPDDLVRLARISCDFTFDPTGAPTGLVYERQETTGRIRAIIHHHTLFEAVGNNPHLPDSYKQAMVLRPGAQGGSEIVGAWEEEAHHVFEYLRRNSYIPWGHFAANMANDSVRYDIRGLSREDMTGLRHLYYQRTFVRMAEQLGIPLSVDRRSLSSTELEEMRTEILRRLTSRHSSFFDSTLWGWNYGFDFAPSGYRLNASHQQIHQQFALLPGELPVMQAGEQTATTMPSFACGDLVADCVRAYAGCHDRSFFADLLTCIRNNTRMDRHPGPSSLIVHEDDQVMLFVPKAQTSQWELQLITLRPVGNILEADTAMRRSLDTGIHLAMQALGGLGVRMVTTIEYAKRFSQSLDQRLLYSFLPKLPESPGAFSEAQLRWIMGHFPEDFAAACRHSLSTATVAS
ncbi:MAG: hypothetical protein ACOY4H_08210 [Thermodesulfobacteriota bacterium]